MMLHFRPEYERAVVSGRKRITIRYGRKYDVRPGNIVFLAVRGRPVAKARITHVYVKKIRDLSEHEIKMEGFRSLNALIRQLRRIYPDIGPDSPVTVIRWKLLRD